MRSTGEYKVDESSTFDDSKNIFYDIKTFTELFLEALARDQKENVKEYVALMGPYIDDEYASDAMNAPKLTTGIGIHDGDWSICRHGKSSTCLH